MDWVDYIARTLHILFGITWIGLLYYFNFVQTEYFKEAEESARKDAVQKLVPRALFYFRYAALFTFLTGLLLWHEILARFNPGIALGMLLGTLMFLNVWLIIWPNQQKVIAGAEDAAQAAPKAALASRTNTLFSFPMLMFMVASPHGAALWGSMAPMGLGDTFASMTFLIGAAIILAIEINAIFGKVGPMASVNGVIHCGLGLAVVLGLVAIFLQ